MQQSLPTLNVFYTCGPRGGHFFKETKMKLKKPLCYNCQVNRLREFHHLEIDNRENAIKILETVNYYRLMGYGVGLKDKDDPELFERGISIEHIFNLYCFDSQLKNNLIKTLEQIEIKLRSQIAYHLAIKYGAESLMDETLFDDNIDKHGESIYSSIVNSVNKEINRQKDLPFVTHHKRKYEGKFPIWVSIELMSFGKLSSLYSIMKLDDKKAIADLYRTDPIHLGNWVHCLVEVRNICAHYTRLYNMPLKQTPKLYPENNMYKRTQNKLFTVLLVIKRMLNANSQWLSLLKDIKVTFKKYSGYYRLSYMGFPDDWIEVLSDDLKRYDQSTS